MNDPMEIVFSGIGDSDVIVEGCGSMEITVGQGFGIDDAGAVSIGSAADLMAGGIVPEGDSSPWQQEMEFFPMDFAFVYVGPALAPIEIRSCYGLGYWIPSRPWLNNESWKY